MPSHGPAHSSTSSNSPALCHPGWGLPLWWDGGRRLERRGDPVPALREGLWKERIQQYPVPTASGLDLELCRERGSSWKGGRAGGQQGQPSCRRHPGLRTQSTVGDVSSNPWLACPSRSTLPDPHSDPPSFLGLPRSPVPLASLSPLAHRSFPAAPYPHQGPSMFPCSHAFWPLKLNLGIPSFRCSP